MGMQCGADVGMKWDFDGLCIGMEYGDYGGLRWDFDES